MPYTTILSAIDAEIARLNEAKSLLSSVPDALESVVTRGRPKGSTKAKTLPAPKKVVVKAKRILSPEARQRISDAQRKRHALAKGE